MEGWNVTAARAQTGYVHIDATKGTGFTRIQDIRDSSPAGCFAKTGNGKQDTKRPDLTYPDFVLVCIFSWMKRWINENQMNIDCGDIFYRLKLSAASIDARGDTTALEVMVWYVRIIMIIVNMLQCLYGIIKCWWMVSMWRLSACNCI